MFGRVTAPGRSHASHAITAFQKLSQCQEREAAAVLDMEDHSNAVPDQVDADPGESEEPQNGPAARDASP